VARRTKNFVQHALSRAKRGCRTSSYLCDMS